MDRVFDPEFVQSQHYAELLIDEIPSNKRFDALIAIYRDKLKGEIYHIGLVVQALIKKLSEDQVKQFLAILSDELSIIRDEKDFRCNMHLIPPNLWEQLSEVSRIRAESRVIKDLREGEAVGRWPQIYCKHGALATWARKHFRFFKLKDAVAKVLIEKLESKKESAACYVTNYFLGQLSEIVVTSQTIERCINAISTYIRENNKSVRNSFIENFALLPERWQKDFGESLQDLTDKDNPALYLYDGSPFLNLLPEEDDDEIPF
jgi:hypothetical protein